MSKCLNSGEEGMDITEIVRVSKTACLAYGVSQGSVEDLCIHVIISCEQQNKTLRHGQAVKSKLY